MEFFNDLAGPRGSMTQASDVTVSHSAASLSLSGCFLMQAERQGREIQLEKTLQELRSHVA